MEQDFYLYYSTQRPVSIGTFPNRPDNPPTEIKNFDARIPVEDGTFMAWGTITFANRGHEKSWADTPAHPGHTAQNTIKE